MGAREWGNMVWVSVFFECLSTCAYENGDNENKSAALKNEGRGRELVRFKVEKCMEGSAQ